MSRYHSTSQYAPSGIADPTVQEAGRADLPRHDRDASPSDSEGSATLNNYSENASDETTTAEDPYHALTSQTLNADGTPKRPMNAFMIFARKRRPQISAANQMMRTGDVSKILSKEWNSMEMTEKKFYLDQAKKLKDNFNSKYPDYVYRRRPNNSRKKRKAEPSHDDPADGHPGDPDDPAYEDTSPIDGDDALMIPSPQDVQYTRPHALNPSPPIYHPHDAVPSSAAAACTYPYSSDFHPHPAQSSRISHLAHSESPLGTGNIGPNRNSSLGDVGALSAQGYPSQSLYQNPSQPSSLYGQQHNAHPAHGLWEPHRAGPRSDTSRSNWPVLPALDTNLARQRPSITSALSNSTNGGRSDAYSPQLPTRPWSSATSSTASSSSGASTSQQHYGTGPATATAGANAFPTLNSAFYPSESPATKAMDLGSPAASAHTPGSSHDYFSSSQLPGGIAGSGRRPSAAANAGPEHGGYGQYGSSAAHAQSAVAGWGSQQQPQQQQQQQQQHHHPYGRSTAGSQRVPGLHSHSHSISPYSLQASPAEGGGARSASVSASGSSVHSAAHLAYWEGR